MILWLVVHILIFRVRGPYLRFGTLLEDNVCSSAIYKKKCFNIITIERLVRCRRGYYFRAWVLYFSFGTYCIRMLILSIYTLLEFINTIYKYGHAWVS